MFLKNSLLISHPRLRAALSLSKGAGLSLLAFAVLVACGDEVTEVTEVNESGMKIIEKGEKLPSCTTDNEGALVYALDSAAAYACVNREWTSFKGDKGDDGANGKDGKDGADGKDGKDGEKGDKGDQGKQGEKGDAGKAGTSCTVEQLPDSSGFKVLCGGDSVGVVLNGEKGEQGDPGEDGKSVEGAENFFIDARDKQIYRKVTIGTQTWMAENLNYETADSRCWLASVENCSKYGRLYSWMDAMDSAAVFSDNAKGCGRDAVCTIKTPVRGICPEGWHIPDSTEWTTLYKTVGESPYALQAKGFNRWTNATDDYGFSVIPVGLYKPDEDMFYNPDAAYFWSASQKSDGDVYYILMGPAGGFRLDVCIPGGNISVRCIKDSAE